jgi:hypothetical protein
MTFGPPLSNDADEPQPNIPEAEQEFLSTYRDFWGS